MQQTNTSWYYKKINNEKKSFDQIPIFQALFKDLKKQLFLRSGGQTDSTVCKNRERESWFNLINITVR